MENLSRYAWLSVAAALLTMGLKAAAYWVTGSVAILSDAAESLVNLVAAALALGALTYAAQPPDEDHAFGHEKVEYFSSGFEGGLILFAAGGIALSALERFADPRPLEQVTLGVALTIVASVINGAVGMVLLRVGRRHRSETLVADAHHLLSDVWSSASVLVGVGIATALTLPWLDPLTGMFIALYLVWTGLKLLRRSIYGLLDTAMEPEEVSRIEALLDGYAEQGVTYHALRTRRAGRSNFVQVHVLVPGDWTVLRGHELVEEFERTLAREFPGTRVLTHLEPVEDPCSFEDISLDRLPA